MLLRTAGQAVKHKEILKVVIFRLVLRVVASCCAAPNALLHPSNSRDTPSAFFRSPSILKYAKTRLHHTRCTKAIGAAGLIQLPLPV